MNSSTTMLRKRYAVARSPDMQGDRLPAHVAIIMDGNGRWAQQRGLLRQVGHEAGLRTVRRVVRACCELGLPALTLYAFSTENWSRPRAEVNFLMNLLLRYIRNDLATLNEENVRVRVYGEREGLWPAVSRALDEAVETTRSNTGLVLGLAFNYGGRADITRAVRRLAHRVQSGDLDPGSITAANIDSELYTAEVPDPDLIIRTGGDQRLSNFLLWQAAYSELFWADTYWPDFDAAHLRKALDEFARRQRRYGGLPGPEQGERRDDK